VFKLMVVTASPYILSLHSLFTAAASTIKIKVTSDDEDSVSVDSVC
jgi:hypothetical protein